MYKFYVVTHTNPINYWMRGFACVDYTINVAHKMRYITWLKRKSNFFLVEIHWTRRTNRKTYRLESFGWKNLFEELIRQFGDVMSARNVQERNSNTSSGPNEQMKLSNKQNQAPRSQCNFTWKCITNDPNEMCWENESIGMAIGAHIAADKQSVYPKWMKFKRR